MADSLRVLCTSVLSRGTEKTDKKANDIQTEQKLATLQESLPVEVSFSEHTRHARGEVRV